MDFEDILKPVGLFSLYQKRLLWLFLVPVVITSAIICMSTVFQVMTPDHWCRVPQLDHLSLSEQRLLAIPKESINGIETYSSCSMYDLNYTEIMIQYSIHKNSGFDFKISSLIQDAKTQKCSNGWTYDRHLVESTAVTELNLVCEKESWPAYVLTLDGIGKILGNPILGYIGDNYGRKSAFLTTAAIGVLSFVSPIFIANYSAFAIFRFINGWISPSNYLIPYIILMEMIGSNYRARIVTFLWICWALGNSLVPLVAFYSRNWIYFSVICAILGCGHFLYIFFIPESPRWLVSQRKYKKAFEILSKMAEVNKRQIPDDYLSQIENFESDATVSKDDSLSFVHFFTNKALRFYVVIICLVWIANNASYYGSLFNFQNFEWNPFVMYSLLSITELPAVLLAGFLMDTRLGRRWTISLCMVIAGTCYSIPMVFPLNWTLAVTVVSIVGRCFGNVAFTVLPQVAAEILPTPLRNQGLGLTSAVAGLSHFVLPHVAVLGRKNVRLPLLVCGLSCILAGFLSSLLPETRNNALPQTLEDCQLLRSNTKYFALAKKDKSKGKDKVEINLVGF